ncbi:hypothetical protein BaRGS_00002840 [Batillaria attramentaria]|uniref:Uncharacterized protein n=1 Tax=Batillaria attramentaria TaxID=370345 RepID=A0ABD0M4C2_9CAEN
MVQAGPSPPSSPTSSRLPPSPSCPDFGAKVRKGKGRDRTQQETNKHEKDNNVAKLERCDILGSLLGMPLHRWVESRTRKSSCVRFALTLCLVSRQD